MIKWLLQLLSALGVIAFIAMGSSASAAGIGVHPQTLEINQVASQETQTEIFVYNTTEEPALYQVFLDNYGSLLRIDSDKFRLEGGESRALTLNIKSFPPGEYSTSISVVAEELSTGASLAKTGVKIPVALNISKGDLSTNRYLVPIIVGLFLIALILFMVSLFGNVFGL